jgi:hypothetical protein
MKKQTAVEWLQIQLKKGIDFNPLEPLSYPKAVDKLFNQAKAMEKEQHQQTAMHFFPTPLKKVDFEQYYNETFIEK